MIGVPEHAIADWCEERAWPSLKRLEFYAYPPDEWDDVKAVAARTQRERDQTATDRAEAEQHPGVDDAP